MFECNFRFEDGAFFVSLAPPGASDFVPATIARVLGIEETAVLPILSSMKDFLKDKQLLLVLDNFEHVVEAAPVVSELLARSGGLNVLTTSRIPLRLYGEHTLFVPPLALPDRRVTPLPQNLVRCESVRLFVERSRAAKTDFTPRGHQPTA